MMQQCGEPCPSIPPCSLVHPSERWLQSNPALRPDSGPLTRNPFESAPSLHASRCLRRFHRYYEPIRLPASARRCAPVFPCATPPTVTTPSDPAGSPGFRCRPFVHDAVLDPGGATPPRMTAAHMLPSCTGTHSASASFNLSGLTCCTLHDSCLRFGRHVTGAPARLGSLLPATALVRKGFHLLVSHQLSPAHSRLLWKFDSGVCLRAIG